MTDDSVRNIEVFQEKIIQKINHTNDRPMKRDKKEKGYNPEREKDKIEIKSQKLSSKLIQGSDEEKNDNKTGDHKNQYQKIDILVE